MDDALPDLLAPDLSVVFCGTAAGRKSAEVRAYYAGPGNRFWAVLHTIGLTPTRLEAVQFHQLLPLGIGLTDIAKRGFGSDSEIARSDYDPDGLRRKIIEFSPGALAFNGKNAASRFLADTPDYGVQPDPIGKTVVFVLPSTSGAANGFWNEAYWHELAAFVTRSRQPLRQATS